MCRMVTFLTSVPWDVQRLLRAGEGSAERRGVRPPFFSSSPEGDFGTVHTGTPSETQQPRIRSEPLPWTINQWWMMLLSSSWPSRVLTSQRREFVALYWSLLGLLLLFTVHGWWIVVVGENTILEICTLGCLSSVWLTGPFFCLFSVSKHF